MYIFAYICLLVGFLAALGCGCMALVQLWQGRANHLFFLRKGHFVISLAFILASALLLHALFWEDYRLQYVASYTDSFLPVFYRLTAFWAGQPGSMLFWGLAVALCGSIFAIACKNAPISGRTWLWFWCLFYASMAFFCIILTCWSNPFIMVHPAPADGNGLNPLLQNPGMIFHPPLLFMGYAGLHIPACLALAQLLSSSQGEVAWFRLSRPFIMLAWIFLTAGIVLGAWWAYMELGWGGYWAWDPVENASLIPWLVATAALHIIAITNAGDKLWRSSAALMALSITGAFFATYLTRSGVIQSVHAFGDGGVGTPLLLFVAASCLVVLLAVLAARARESNLSSLWGREGALVVVAWIFMALAIIILIATTWPVISALAGFTARGLDASFYNRVCLPPGAFLMVVLCLCSWLGWNGGLAQNHAGSKLCLTLGAFIAAIATIWMLGYRQPVALVSAAAGMAVIVAMLLQLPDKAFWKIGRRRAAVGAHLGMAILVIGIAFSGPYTQEKELMLARGQKDVIGPYTVSLVDVGDGSGKGYDYLRATLKISLGHKEIGLISPERRIYQKFGTMQFSEVDVISSLKEDIYASLLGMDEDFKVLVRVSIEPLVNWIWVGGTLLCLLPLFGIGGNRRYGGQGFDE